MNSSRMLVRAAGLIILTALLISGCAREQSGTAVPTAGGATTTSPPSTEATNDFGALKSCDLLTEALRGKGFSPAETESYGGPNSCSSEKSMYASIGLSLQVGAPYDQIETESDKLHRGEIHGRRAIQIRNGLGGDGACAVMLEVGPKSRAFVNSVTTGMTTDEACSFVTSIAENIEPMLPRVR